MIQSSKPRFLRVFIYLFIVLLFFVLLFAAYRATGLRPTKHYTTLLHNGTASFAPTTILISLDGFRADFLQRNLTPTMQAFVNEGVSPLYMNPSFPSVTFPNHWTLATGLYPESHGIVGNTFWDPELEQDFYYTHTDVSMQSQWWGGNPLWATAESQGIRTAVHMWPGSEAEVGEFQPAHIDKYNGSEKLSVKVDRILGFLDLPGPESPHATADQPRPQLIAAYVPDVDSDGHRYGPNSTEIRTTITAVDTMLGSLFAGIEARNLTNIVNVVIVSDHGMATTDISRLIQLEDLIDTDLISHTDGWPLYGLRPKNPDNLDRLYQELKSKAAENPNIDVYLRDFDMPERYHFAANARIAPLWIVPKTGWAIVTKDEFDVAEGLRTGASYHPHGLHGYDHEHPLMRAIFLARGPAFPHAPGSLLEPFRTFLCPPPTKKFEKLTDEQKTSTSTTSSATPLVLNRAPIMVRCACPSSRWAYTRISMRRRTRRTTRPLLLRRSWRRRRRRRVLPLLPPQLLPHQHPRPHPRPNQRQNQRQRHRARKRRIRRPAKRKRRRETARSRVAKKRKAKAKARRAGGSGSRTRSTQPKGGRWTRRIRRAIGLRRRRGS